MIESQPTIIEYGYCACGGRWEGYTGPVRERPDNLIYRGWDDWQCPVCFSWFTRHQIMALSQPVPTSDLKQMTNDQLFEYFCENSGYFPESPENAQYAIRLGSRGIFAAETDELFEKFKKAVARA